MNKTFKLEIKDLGEQGTFTGMASVYGNRDLGGDVVEPGAFSKTLADKNGEVPILWQHDPREPIGMGKLMDSGDGLMIKGELAIDSSPIAVKAYGLMRRGILKGLSIGYDTMRDEVKEVAGKTTRYLKELKLWEVSIVTFPMNELATVSTVKAVEDARLELAEFIEQQKQSLRAPFEEHAAAMRALELRIAALEGKDAPEIFHPSLESISQLLRS